MSCEHAPLGLPQIGDVVYKDGQICLIDEIRTTIEGRFQHICTTMSPLCFAIQQLQALYLPQENASLAQKQLMIGLNNRYIAAMHWVNLKKLGRGQRNKYPLNTTDARNTESWADLMMSRLNLCEGLHQHYQNLLRIYPEVSSNSWIAVPEIHWLDIETEFKQAFIYAHTQNMDQPLIASRAWQQQQKGIHERLRHNENPFSDNLPHFFHLIEAACKLSDCNQAFKEKYWKPFLTAFQRDYQHADTKSHGVIFVRDNCLYQTAQGSPKRLKSPTKKGHVKDERLVKYYCL